MNSNYKLTVEIYDPATLVGMFSGLRLYLFCDVFCDPNDFGNGCYVSIRGEGFSKNVFDVRYDKSFNFDEPAEWLKKWAKNYWNGCNGAWSIKSLQVLKID